MRSRTLAVVAVALVVALAGCAGTTGVSGTTTDGTAGTATTDPGTATDVGAADRSNVNFYLSDEENDIDDFAHLNVTITEVGLHRVDDGNESGDGEWVTRDVDGATVDLTRLRGANASRIAQFDVPAGTYDGAFVYVSDVDGTLKGSGESVRVKLPSGKLQIHEGFTTGPNASVDFVFDISVHQAGKSGKYVLKPVVAESGTDVPIEDVDDDRRQSDDAPGKSDDDPGESDEGDDVDEENDDEGDENRAAAGGDESGEEGTLTASFVGDVVPGESATIAVELDGGPVKNAQVFVDGERVGKTDADGRASFTVPEGDEVEVEVKAKSLEAEIEREFEDESN